ncbi:serine protease 33-like [Brachionichthys hirsutus]|uniref:serine protease 33-like n=1 Tax=Brachionichthys hirsutus TaxID=412623 RepID=UPI003604A50E
MEVKLVACGVALLAFMVTGINAQPEVCGIAPRNTRITGGKDAPVGAWPWMAGVNVPGGLFCGGSLISSEWVLTAAQCVAKFPASSFTIYLGRHSLNGANPNEVLVNVSKVVAHPDFKATTFDNDIALLRLSRAVTFTDYIRPVCLAATGSEYLAGEECWITGWGNVNKDVPLPPPQTLQEVTVPIVSNSDCNKVYGGAITNNMICAGPSGGGRGSCSGDGGGPMVRKASSKWVQGGVMSFIAKAGCALPNVPGGYARVSQYESWIKKEVTTNQPGFVRAGTARLVSLSLPLLLSLGLAQSWF